MGAARRQRDNRQEILGMSSAATVNNSEEKFRTRGNQRPGTQVFCSERSRMTGQCQTHYGFTPTAFPLELCHWFLILVT
jgi:hypothetical protein